MVLEVKVIKRTVDFNKSKKGSFKKVVIVEFHNPEFIHYWMPTYAQINEIIDALNEIEQSSWGKPAQLNKLNKSGG